ncbi:MAG: hypothetical protein ACP5E9_01650 [Candidatus Methanospirareceae archaeon]
MKSQVITSIIFISIGLILLMGYPITLIYSIPLILIGLALYLFRGREAIIEHPTEEYRR